MPRKLPLFALLVLLLAGCGPRPTSSPPTPSAEQLQLEEQAVYAAVLNDTLNASMVVLMDATATDPGGVENTASTVEYASQNLRDLDKTTIEDFKVRNDKAYPLPPDMDLGIEYILLTQAQRNEMFGPNQSGWETFYNNYPDAPGITDLSRVGFNAAFDQALVYVGTQSQYLAGAGYYYLLKKIDGTWTVDQKVMTWIS